MINNIIGFVGKITENEISGWAINLNSNQKPQLKLKINGELLKEAQLEWTLRKDINAKYNKSGCNGFKFALNKDTVSSIKSVEVITNKNIKLKIAHRVTNKIKILNTNTISFIHIPKTAGTSIRYELSEVIDQKYIFPNNKVILENNGHYPHLHKLKSISKDFFSDFRFITGHYPLTFFNKKSPDSFKFTFLRDPIVRSISNINHLYNYDPKLKGANTELIIQKSKYQLSNLQVRYLCDDFHAQKLTNEHLEQALKNLQSIDFIGITDSYSEYYKKFKSILLNNFSIKINSKEKSLNLSKRKARITQKELDILKTFNSLDKKLLDAIKQSKKR